MEFRFKNIKTPGWVENGCFSIYYSVYENEKEIGYIGLQELDFSRMVCNNICYKTFEPYRNQGKKKEYFKQFLNNCPFDFDVIRAKVMPDNIASQKILEYANCEVKVKHRDDGRICYTWKKC